MENVIFIAFITGLTAGGLSCFAVQGGLLSGSIAQQVEANVRAKNSKTRSVRTESNKASKNRDASSKKQRPADSPKMRAGMFQQVMLFMAAKLAAYTALGFLLGWLGSIFSISPLLQGFIQLAVGIFLVGNALRMFNVHPIFRYFTFEPPSQVTRYIRRVSKREDTWITPVILGALTVLIPCGVTQSMMALAIGTGSPLLGAVIMFAFILGTSPTFIGISWLVTNLGGLFQKHFYHIVAVILLALGLYTVNGGLVLVGSPISSAAMFQAAQSNIPAAEMSNVARIDVKNNGYAPNRISLPADQPIELHLITDGTHSCSRAFVIPELGISSILPETGDTLVNIPARATGTRLDFMCSMGMFTGSMQFK